MERELSPELQAKALTELGETDARKRQALQQFREWIAKQRHIIKCRTDDNFLLRFLRVKKYASAQAFKMFEKFLVCLQSHPEWFANLSLNNDRLLELVNSGYIFPLTERDNNGSRVILIQARMFDTKKFSLSDIIRAINFITFTLMEESETQISGFVYLIDHADISLDYIGLFSIMEVKMYLKYIQNAIPGRQKKGVWLNLPAFAVAFTEIAKTFVSQKLRDRASFYSGSNEIYKYADKNILPKEYGGHVPCCEMIENFKRIAIEMNAKVREIEDQQIDIDYVRKNGYEEVEAIQSFRKLEID